MADRPPKLPNWWPALQQLFTTERTTIMAAIDDLNAALTTISTAVSDAAAELQALVAKLGASNDPAIEAVATQLQTLATNLESAVAAAKTAAP